MIMLFPFQDAGILLGLTSKMSAILDRFQFL